VIRACSRAPRSATTGSPSCSARTTARSGGGRARRSRRVARADPEQGRRSGSTPQCRPGWPRWRMAGQHGHAPRGARRHRPASHDRDPDPYQRPRSRRPTTVSRAKLAPCGLGRRPRRHAARPLRPAPTGVRRHTRAERPAGGGAAEVGRARGARRDMGPGAPRSRTGRSPTSTIWPQIPRRGAPGRREAIRRPLAALSHRRAGGAGTRRDRRR
jgi:hypothetical protein